MRSIPTALGLILCQRVPGALRRGLQEEQAPGIEMLFPAQPWHYVKVTVTF